MMASKYCLGYSSLRDDATQREGFVGCISQAHLRDPKLHGGTGMWPTMLLYVDPRESSWNLNLSGLHVAMIQTRMAKMTKPLTETSLPSIVLVGFHRGLYHSRVFPTWVHPWTSDHFHNPAVAQMILSVLIGSHPSFRTLTGHLTSSLPRTHKERRKSPKGSDPSKLAAFWGPYHW